MAALSSSSSLPALIHRHLLPYLQEAMTDTPAVLVIGPRQSGKTTLVRQFTESMPYLSLDDATRLAAARADPQGFVRQLDRAIIDEIQRAPELLLALKFSIDNDRRPGRFLLTGSANVMSLPTVADSLAGRIEVHALLPLSNAELRGRTPDFLERALSRDWSAPSGADTSGNTGVNTSGDVSRVGDALIEHVLAGGYPEMRSRATPRRRQAWAQAYLTTLVERDIRDVARIDEATRIPQLMAVLATLSGQLLNLRQIGGQLGLNQHTAEKYIGILEQLFLVRRLPAWSRSELSRLVKTPKIHFLDAGLHGALLRANTAWLREDRSRLGAILESWVCGELLKVINLSPDRWFLSHYRDKDQVEVDYVLESPLRAVVGIEVKAAATVTLADFKGLRRLRDAAGTSFATGIVLYDGSAAVPFGEGLWAVPLSWL
jgi:predicted AAA+ superfamily ATPase